MDRNQNKNQSPLRPLPIHLKIFADIVKKKKKIGTLEIQLPGTLEKKGEKVANYKPGRSTLTRNETDQHLVLDCPCPIKVGG